MHAAESVTADQLTVRFKGRHYRLVPVDDPPAEAAMPDQMQTPQAMAIRPRNWVLIGMRSLIVGRVASTGAQALKVQDILDDIGDGKLWQMFLEVGLQLLIQRIRELLAEVE